MLWYNGQWFPKLPFFAVSSISKSNIWIHYELMFQTHNISCWALLWIPLSGHINNLFSPFLIFFVSTAQSERQAVNTAIQGSAADLVKLAMVNIQQALRETFPMSPAYLTAPMSSASCKESRGAHLILHLHDELMYEVRGNREWGDDQVHNYFPHVSFI